jgi:hypothetical protein
MWVAVSGCWQLCHSLFVSQQSRACDESWHTTCLRLFNGIAAAIPAKCMLALHNNSASRLDTAHTGPVTGWLWSCACLARLLCCIRLDGVRIQQ